MDMFCSFQIFWRVKQWQIIPHNNPVFLICDNKHVQTKPLLIWRTAFQNSNSATLFVCDSAERNVQTWRQVRPNNPSTKKCFHIKDLKDFRNLLPNKETELYLCLQIFLLLLTVQPQYHKLKLSQNLTSNADFIQIAISNFFNINSVLFMYLSGEEKPIFKEADSCYVKEKCLRPETVLHVVLTSPQPWLIISLR